MPSTAGIVASGVSSAALTPTITDTFTRADSTTTLGTTDTGQAWTAHVGTWGISTNRAYSVTAADGDIATVDFGSVDQSVTGTISAGLTVGRSAQLVARFTDNNNWYLLVCSTAQALVYKRVAGTLTLVGSASVPWVNGDVMNFAVSGTGSQVVRRNGSIVLSTTDTALTTGNRAGIRWGATSSAVRIDNFEVAIP